MTFALDPRLAGDTLPIGDLRLCRVLLMNDARYNWLILVPRRAGLVELTDLDHDARGLLMDEIALASRALKASRGVDKINIGALGNIVRQLHVHVVARTVNDHSWPGPVWGVGVAQRLGAREARDLIAHLTRALGPALVEIT
jgi:diadenosine tetraphosphate (Ap4A) HIT family hydrolase